MKMIIIIIIVIMTIYLYTVKLITAGLMWSCSQVVGGCTFCSTQCVLFPWQCQLQF